MSCVYDAGSSSRQVGQRQRVADAGDDVLALGVRQVVAVDAGLPGGRVAGERDAGARVVAQVAEHHRADVDRGAQVVRDALAAPVEPRPVGVPGVEDRPDRQVELLARVLRELGAGVLAASIALNSSDELRAGRRRRGSTSVGTPARCLGLVQRVREQLARRCRARSCRTSGAAGGRSPRRTARRRWPRPGPCTDASFRPMFRTVSIIPGIENLAPERTRHQQRVVPVARAAGRGRPRAARSAIVDLHPQLARLRARLQVGAARLGGDREPRRHRQAEVGHLGQVGALAAEQVLLVLVALGEVVHVLGHAVRPVSAVGGRRG